MIDATPIEVRVKYNRTKSDGNYGSISIGDERTWALHQSPTEEEVDEFYSQQFERLKEEVEARIEDELRNS